MIEAIKKIGQFYAEKNDISDELLLILENPYGASYGERNKGLFICFDEDYKYMGVEQEDLSNRDDYWKYLYKVKGNSGSNYTPSALVTSVDKLFSNKLDKWIEKTNDREDKDGFYLELPEMQALVLAYRKNRDSIFNLIQTNTNTIREAETSKEKFNILVSFKINGHYVGELDSFRAQLLTAYKRKLDSCANPNGLCSVCQKIGTVYGELKPANFYTLNEPSFVAGGFDARHGYRNFPVCYECGAFVQYGWLKIEQYLKARISDQSTLLIPNPIINPEVFLKEVLDIYEDQKREITIASINDQTEDEDRILYALGKTQSLGTFNLIFYKASNESFSIKLLLNEVYPSRLQVLSKAKSEIEKLAPFKNYKSGKTSGMTFHFGIVGEFYPPSKGFYEIIEKIFKGGSIEQKSVIQHLFEQISSAFRKDLYFKQKVMQGFLLLTYLQKIGLIQNKTKGHGTTMNNIKVGKAERVKMVELFFSEMGSTFDSPEKKAIFLLGILTEFLLYLQNKDGKISKPFRKKLKSLKMNEKDIRSLLPELLDKYSQYQQKGYWRYPSLESLLSLHMGQSGQNWKMSVGEINFYFALGMSLAYSETLDGTGYFKNTQEEKNQEEEVPNE